MPPNRPRWWNKHSSRQRASITLPTRSIEINKGYIMALEVKVPVLPESVSDATIATWHKQPGDAVKRDENLVDLETDKVVLEVPAPTDGVLKEIVKKTGETVGSQEVIAVIEPGAQPKAAPAKADAPPAK